MVGYHRETHHFREEKSTKEFTAPQHTRFILPLTSPDKIIATLRGRYFSFMVTCRGGGPSILLTQDRSVAQKPHWGFCCCANASLPWQAEQAHHTPSKEKQSVPDGERPVVHIAIVCGFWQGASFGVHPVFSFVLNLLTRDFLLHSEDISPVRRSGSNRHSPVGHCR